MKNWLLGLVLGAAWTHAASGATVLLDPAAISAGPVALPGPQGWLLGFDGSDTTQTGVPGQGIVFDSTTTRTDKAGLFSHVSVGPLTFTNPNVPVLDRTSGFRLGFELEIRQEAHNARDDNNDGKFDRAGFSVIAISEDLLGVEVAFFEDRVWIYEDASVAADSLFTQAEFAEIDTTGGVVDYELTFLGEEYALRADGALILSGVLRDYAAGGAPADVYGQSSFLFF